MSWWSDHVQPLAQDPSAAGVVGALLSLRWVPGDSWSQRFFSLIAGCSLAFFGVPFMVDFLGIQSKGGPAIFGLFAGLLAMNIFGKTVEWVKETKFSDIVNLIRGKSQ